MSAEPETINWVNEFLKALFSGVIGIFLQAIFRFDERIQFIGNFVDKTQKSLNIKINRFRLEQKSIIEDSNDTSQAVAGRDAKIDRSIHLEGCILNYRGASKQDAEKLPRVGTPEEALSNPKKNLISDDRCFLSGKTVELFAFHNVTDYNAEDFSKAKLNLEKGRYVEAAVDYIIIFNKCLSLFKINECYKNANSKLKAFKKAIDELSVVRDGVLSNDESRERLFNAERAILRVFSAKIII